MDYYEILGISKDATDEEIKKQYKQLAKKFHPDKNKSDPKTNEKFNLINNAYKTLIDPYERDKYDYIKETEQETQESTNQFSPEVYDALNKINSMGLNGNFGNNDPFQYFPTIFGNFDNIFKNNNKSFITKTTIKNISTQNISNQKDKYRKKN